MSKELSIDVGDFVTVMFGNSVPDEYCVKVLYMPQDTGDSWHLQRPSGLIVYVQAFAKMLKVDSPETIRNCGWREE